MAVLVVVTIDQRHDDKRCFECVDQFVGGHTAAHHADAHRCGLCTVDAESFAQHAVHPLTQRGLHRRAGGLAATSERE